jgi:hypothetical protein
LSALDLATNAPSGESSNLDRPRGCAGIVPDWPTKIPLIFDPRETNQKLEHRFNWGAMRLVGSVDYMAVHQGEA